ncbi:MAG: hypothetical protein Q4E16_06220 [Neisseria sp.]|nr:hypothetical protein [Neisseria sp.]
MKHFPLSALALACTVALTACGGGGGSSAPSVSSTNTSANSNTGAANSNVNIPSGSNQDAAAKAAAAAKDQAAIAAQKAAEEAKAKAEAEAAAAAKKAAEEAAAKAEAERIAAEKKAAEEAAAKAKAEADAAAQKAAEEAAKKAEAERVAAEKAAQEAAAKKAAEEAAAQKEAEEQAAAEKAAQEAEAARKAAEEAAAKAKTEAEAAAAKKAAEEAEAARKAAEEAAAQKAAEEAAAKKAAEEAAAAAEAAAKKAAEEAAAKAKAEAEAEAARKAAEEAAKNSSWNTLFAHTGTITFKGVSTPAMAPRQLGGGILSINHSTGAVSMKQATPTDTADTYAPYKEIMLDGHKLYLLEKFSDAGVMSRSVTSKYFETAPTEEVSGHIGSSALDSRETDWQDFRWGLVNIGNTSYAFAQGLPSSYMPGGSTAYTAKFSYTGRAAYVRNNQTYRTSDLLVEVDLTADKKQIAIGIGPNAEDKDGNRPRERMIFGGTINGNTFEGTQNGIQTKGGFYGNGAASVAGVFQGISGENQGVVGAFGASVRKSASSLTMIQ